MEERLEAVGVRVLFLESLCSDPTNVGRSILAIKLRSLDYRNADSKESVDGFTKCIQQFEVVTEIFNDKAALRAY